MSKLIITIFLFSFFIGNVQLNAQYVWRKRACPIVYQGGAISFVLNNKAYIVGGDTLPSSGNSSISAAVWEYDPATDTWTRRNNFPHTTNNPTSFVINGTAYVGLGLDNSVTFHGDFWRYDQVNDAWIQIADFPGPARYGAMAFTLNGLAYVGCGKVGSEFNDFYSYDPTSNMWAQLVNFPGQGRQEGVAGTVGGKGYMGLGYGSGNYYSDIYRYNDTVGGWTEINSFTTTGRSSAGSFVLNDTLYVMGGEDPSTYYTDCYRYIPSINNWQSQANFACYTGNEIFLQDGFAINGHGYIRPLDALTPLHQLLEFGPFDTAFVTRVHVLGNDTSGCGNSSRILSTGNSCTLWSTGVTGSQITVTSSGTYWAYWADSCGMVSDTIHIGIGTIAPITITGDTIICSNDSARVCAPSGFASYNWNGGGSDECVEAEDAGDYYVTVTDANGCTAESNHVSIKVYPVPSVSVIIYGDTLSSYGAVTYQWLLNNSPISGAIAPIYIAKEPGLYSLEVTDTNSCSEISQQFVITGVADLIERNVSLFPNPATNSCQLIVDDGLMGSKLEIYDDKGSLVFQSAIRNPKSEMTIAALPSGIYFLHISSSAINITRKLVKL